MIRYISILYFISILYGCSPKIAPDSGWRDRRWVVYEVNGTPVQLSGTNRDAHLNFSPGNKQFTGSGGCNRISGNYDISNNGRISFSDPIRTKMACEDIAFEDNFLRLLSRVNRFSMENETMFLKEGNRVLLMLK